MDPFPSNWSNFLVIDRQPEELEGKVAADNHYFGALLGCLV